MSETNGSTGIDVSGAADVSAREDEGTAVHVLDANGEPAYAGDTPVTITIAGTYSKRYRKAKSAQTDRLGKQRRSSWSIEAQITEQVAASIITWEGFTNGGQPFPYTKENATELLTKAPWIQDQLWEAMNDHASFFSKSSSA